jgi:nucleotide-binding universal stress UspA family protein
MEVGMFKTIIWATDGSRAAEQALPYAKGLAMAGRARLIVVHVDEFSVGKGGGYSIYVDEPETEAAIRRRVEELKREGLDASLQTSRVLMGGAAHVIADIAKQEQADLIVAGTRGHGPVAGLLLGSVTHRLVQIAQCPVLVVPANNLTN